MRAIPESGVADVREIDKSVCDRPEVRVRLKIRYNTSSRNLDLTNASEAIEFGGYLGVCII